MDSLDCTDTRSGSFNEALAGSQGKLPGLEPTTRAGCGRNLRELVRVGGNDTQNVLRITIEICNNLFLKSFTAASAGGVFGVTAPLVRQRQHDMA